MNAHQQQQLEITRDYVERLKREHPLRELFWECTLRCNMACRHCLRPLLERERPRLEITLILSHINQATAAPPPGRLSSYLSNH